MAGYEQDSISERAHPAIETSVRGATADSVTQFDDLTVAPKQRDAE